MLRRVGLGVVGLGRQAGLGPGRQTYSGTRSLLLGDARRDGAQLRAERWRSPMSTRGFHMATSLWRISNPVLHAAKPIIRPSLPFSQRLQFLTSETWNRYVSSRAARSLRSTRRNKSSVSDGSKVTKSPASQVGKASATAKAASQSTAPASSPLLDRLTHLHRPTKEELLAAASGFWSRLGVRFKWSTIRSVRPFNMDEIVGFASWIVLGHFVWLLIGTTTFFSLVLWTVNTVSAQEALAKWIGGHLTQSSGLSVVFESAIVPKWKDGVISFGKVFISRRPTQEKSKVIKGSQAEAAAAATNAERPEISTHQQDDGNYSQFDITVDTLNVTLSFAKWFNGKGLLKDVEMKGIRGVIDRTHLKPLEFYVDPRSYKHQHNTGDFELDSFKMEDLLVTVYQPDNFRPFQVSIFSCDLPRLRQQWLFYDFMSANNISGAIDNSLFTVHPRQTHNYTESRLSGGAKSDGEVKKQTRLRIDGLNIDHLNRGVEGPFSWIQRGNVDVIADVLFPAEDDESVAKIVSDVIDRVEQTVITNSIPPPRHNNCNFSTSEIYTAHADVDENSIPKIVVPEPKQELVMEVKIHLNDVRAAVPLFTKDLSYVNNALIRPIVAYINAQRTFIPITLRVAKERAEFDGSWTLFDSGLMDDLNQEVYNAFVHSIYDDAQARRRRIKKVGIWTLQLAAQALFVGMAGNFA